ncbi:MAG: LysE family transporter [Pseudohongiellaceae bacterium]
MTMEVWLLYVGTLLLFMSTPGPSHLLMISVSLANGFRRSLATAAGDLSANTIQILLAGMGLAVLVTGSRYGFALVKWAGVAYLVWIGLRTLRASFGDRTESRPLPTASLKLLWLRGFITSAANPKAVVFFAALFPQFLDPATMLAPQIAILGATYIVIDGLFLMTYGRGASWLAAAVADRHRAWLDRGAGCGLIAAAVLLGLRSAGR